MDCNREEGLNAFCIINSNNHLFLAGHIKSGLKTFIKELQYTFQKGSLSVIQDGGMETSVK